RLGDTPPLPLREGVGGRERSRLRARALRIPADKPSRRLPRGAGDEARMRGDAGPRAHPAFARARTRQPPSAARQLVLPGWGRFPAAWTQLPSYAHTRGTLQRGHLARRASALPGHARRGLPLLRPEWCAPLRWPRDGAAEALVGRGLEGRW